MFVTHAPAKSGVHRSDLGFWGAIHAVDVVNSARAWRFR